MCYININVPSFGSQSYSPVLTVPTMSLYILLIFYKRKNIDSSIFIKLLVRSIWCFCNVSCKLDQSNLRVQTNSKKWYVVLLVQILLQKSFFIQNPQGYQNDIKANKTIYHASVLGWRMLDTESTFAKACICF